MAETSKTSNTAPNVPPVGNGTTDKPKVERKQREVPTIVCSPDKAEHTEILEALQASMGGLKLNIALGPFVLAAALAHIRSNPKIQAALGKVPATK